MRVAAALEAAAPFHDFMSTMTTQSALPPKPIGVTPGMWRKFLKAFGHGCDLWTSEDGSMTGLAVARVADAPAILTEQFGHFLKREKPITMERLKPRYAYRE